MQNFQITVSFIQWKLIPHQTVVRVPLLDVEIEAHVVVGLMVEVPSRTAHRVLVAGTRGTKFRRAGP